MFNEKYSHEKKFKFDGKDNEWMNVADYVAAGHPQQFTVRAVFSYDSKFGKRPCVATDGFNITMPNHVLGDVDSIMNHDDEIEAINAGKCGCKITTYQDKNNVTRYSCKFFDIN